MKILVHILPDHLESAFLVGFVQDIYDVPGKSHGTVERHAETSSANVVSDDAIFEVMHYQVSPTDSVSERVSITSAATASLPVRNARKINRAASRHKLQFDGGGPNDTRGPNFGRRRGNRLFGDVEEG